MINLGHLDLNVVEHCNFSCVNCSHASPQAAPWFMPLDMIERDLLALKPFVNFRNLQLVGGEPLLHKELAEIMRLSKHIRIDSTLIVITNGSLLPRMPEEFFKELEYLQISVYPTLDRGIIQLAEDKAKQYGFGLGIREFTEFHRQFRKEPNDGQHFATCHWKSDCYTVHRGHFYLCPQSAFFPKNFMAAQDEIDGLQLTDLTEEKLKAFLNRAEPLHACKMCCANEMRPAPWREAKRKEWLTVSKEI